MVDVRIETERGGAIRTIVLDRHAKRNALSPHIFAALIEAFEAKPPAQECVTLIRAEGTVFCAGVDLSERIQNGWPQQSPLVRLCELMRTYPVPIVAAMQGDAIAGGAMMIMHCDLIIAAEGARLAMPLSQLGIAPPWILTSRTVDRIGAALAREMLFLGYPVTAERLYQANAVNAVVPRERFAAEVARVVDRLARNAPLSLRAVKGALTRIGEAGLGKDVTAEDRLTRIALDSLDSKEGMKARLEKREPQFVGR